MANRSEKRNKLMKSKYFPYFMGSFIFISVVQFFQLIAYYRKSTLTLISFLVIGIHFIANLFSVKQIGRALEFGLSYGTYMDVMAANSVLILLSLYSFKVYYIFLSLIF